MNKLTFIIVGCQRIRKMLWLKLLPLFVVIGLFLSFTCSFSSWHFPNLYFKSNSVGYNVDSIEYFERNNIADSDSISSLKILTWVKVWMDENPNIILMKIIGHADFMEKDTLIALKRAEKVKNDLVKLGVDSKRLIVHSCGSSMPLMTRSDIESFQSMEEKNRAHSINMRVVFYIEKCK